ncbi:hybrid sensor histidine kinase/response regulator [Burkholderia ubonensis]|nr:ATP-binding protein [Burkholderia ubonensis]
MRVDAVEQGTSPPKGRGLGKEVSVLNLLGSYQRGLLYGGSIALSLAIAMLLAYSVYATVQGYLAQSHAALAMSLSWLHSEMEACQTTLSRTVAASEILWADRHSPDLALRQAFATQGQRAMISSQSGKVVQLVIGQRTTPVPIHDQETYLGFAQALGRLVDVGSTQQADIFRGYVYNPARSFVSIVAPAASVAALKLLESKDASELIEMLAPNVRDLPLETGYAKWSEPRRVSWMSSRINPLSHERVFQLVQPALVRDHVFAIFVAEISVDILRNSLKPMPLDGELLVIARNGEVVLHSEGDAIAADTTLAIRAVQAGTWREGFERRHDGYHDGIFTISQAIAGTDWVLAYVWSWRTVVVALWPALLPRVAGVLGILVLQWILVWLFDRKVFTPAYERSRRVFDSEHLNRLIISTVPVGLGLLTADRGEILLENALMQRYNADEKLNPGEFGRRLVALYHQHAGRAGSGSAMMSQELSWNPTGVQPSDLLVRMVAARYEDRDVLLCGIADITERRQTERALQAASESADAASRAKSAFVASMSHELRTPLNALLGHLELLGQDIHAPALAARVTAMMSASTILLNVVNAVLDMSRIEAGQMELEEVDFKLDELIEAVVALFMPKSLERRIILISQVHPNASGTYRGDPTRIRQILVNLIDNAFKFTERGAVSVIVERGSVEDYGHRILVSVKDTGIGIAKERHARIFEAFAQADVSIARRFGGTGLGLALCKKMVALMGGTISVSSTVGRGSTFRIMLPLAPRNVDCHVPERFEKSIVQSDVQRRSRRSAHLLVVDDQEMNREIIRDQLRALGYTCDVARDGLDALGQFHIQHYDAVLTDLVMTGMDGYALASCLRDEDGDIPIIAITANATATERSRCARVGIVDVLIKPVSLAVIEASLRHHLDGRATLDSAKPGVEARARFVPTVLTRGRYQILKLEAKEILKEFDHSIQQEDTTSVSVLLHSLKGLFSVALEESVVNACAGMEARLHGGDWGALREGYHDLRKIVDAVLTRLEPAS